jgi:DNA replication and repair protein RecF
MRLVSLLLRNFRNVEELSLSFSPGKNIILGKNGQGKTNLLESIAFLSHSKSYRTSQDRELIRHHQQFTTLRADIESIGYEGTTQLEAYLSVEEDRLKTLFKANGIALKSRSQVLGFIPTVSFFLSDLLLLRGTPEDRRKWLDTAITQYDKRHFIYLAEFGRIKQQKSKLLKEDPSQISATLLDTLNQQFARLAARVVASRVQYVSLIQDMLMMKYLELAGTREKLSINYISNIQKQNLQQYEAFQGYSELQSLSVEAIEATILEVLQQRKGEEIRRGVCLVGPHRDDILFLLEGVDATAFGSQGQQRSIVLALKLTELALLGQKLCEPPVLLLDDVMAELDPKRQQCLLDRLAGENQVFLTTTHLDDFLKPLIQSDRGATVFQVEQGRVATIQKVTETIGKTETPATSATELASF